jgi:hypothetical protein
MIKIHSNIIVGSCDSLLQSTILPHVHYIINCSTNLNNLIVHPNYINLGVDKFGFKTLRTLNSLSDFVNEKISLGNNIFLLCENGIGHSLVVGMFIIMKMHNINFDQVFNQLSASYNINNYDFYSGLKRYEPFIKEEYKKNNNYKMDLE